MKVLRFINTGEVMGITLDVLPHIIASHDMISTSNLYRDWADNFRPDQQVEVRVNSAEVWANEPGQPEEVQSLQLTYKQEGDRYTRDFGLRPPTVDVFTTITDGENSYVPFVEQYRAAIGARVCSNVAGGKNWDETPEQTVDKELWQELKLESSPVPFTTTRNPMRDEPREVSPGLTNERTWFFWAQITVAPEDLTKFVQDLDGKSTGVADEDEFIVVRVVPLHKASRFIASQPRVDLKTEMSLGYAKLL